MFIKYQKSKSMINAFPNYPISQGGNNRSATGETPTADCVIRN